MFSRGSPTPRTSSFQEPPDGVIGLLAGALNKDAASNCGVSVTGDIRRIARLKGHRRAKATAFSTRLS